MASIGIVLIQSRPLRFSTAALCGALATLAIFAFMYRLIGSGPIQRPDDLLFTSVSIYEPPQEVAPQPEIEQQPEPANTPTVEPTLAPLSVHSPTPHPVLQLAGPPVPSFEPSLGDITLASGDGTAFGAGHQQGDDDDTWTPPGDEALAKKIAGATSYREILPLATRQPNVPEYAWKNHIDGWVLVAFSVNANGLVENVRVLDAHPRGVFEENVIASVKHWIYSPADFGGHKVKVQLTQKIELFWKDYPNNNKQLK